MKFLVNLFAVLALVLVPTTTYSMAIPPPCNVEKVAHVQIDKEHYKVLYHVKCLYKNGFRFYLSSPYGPAVETDLIMSDGPVDKFFAVTVSKFQWDYAYPKLEVFK
jgi:hypothetical protein